jgi:hypothetical protein
MASATLTMGTTLIWPMATIHTTDMIPIITPAGAIGINTTALTTVIIGVVGLPDHRTTILVLKIALPIADSADLPITAACRQVHKAAEPVIAAVPVPLLHPVPVVIPITGHLLRALPAVLLQGALIAGRVLQVLRELPVVASLVLHNAEDKIDFE